MASSGSQDFVERSTIYSEKSEVATDIDSPLDDLSLAQTESDSRQNAEEEELIRKLEESLKLKKHGRSTRYISTLENGLSVTSWKFSEWDYANPNVVLPTNARGLFTLDDSKKILVRGYDKFFNVGEVPETKIDYLRENTIGPYRLTLKENGCIIFIAGLEDGSIVVTSKHSLGSREGMTRNHASRGEYELRQQLGENGISVEALAKRLYTQNLTAVAELCDDSFEEHVLPYSRDEGEAGLYLHGLNYNTVKFKTCPMEEVQQFADEFQFHKIQNFQIEKFDELQSFFENCSKTGTYKGKEVEGFVIRCKTKFKNEDYFYKYKFEEPYLLYRQFRELTKRYISTGDVGLVKYEVKKHRYLSYHYIDFVEGLFKEHPDMAEQYERGIGIIKVRELFTEYCGKRGMDLLELDALDGTVEMPINEFKYVLIPIATIGCGKTTTFQTLVDSFPPGLIGHVQNDNIGSKSKFKFVDSCLNELAHSKTQIVCCDRNNHMWRERTQLFDNFETNKLKFLLPTVGIKFICCNFVSPDDETRWNVTYNRVVKRGNNHQSIKSEGDKGVELAKAIMNGFINRYQPLNTRRQPDSKFDLVINLEVSENRSSLDNAKVIVSKLNEEYPGLLPYIPTESQYEESFQRALLYTPTFTKIIPNKGSSSSAYPKATIGNKDFKTAKNSPKPSYYGVRISDKDSLIRLIESSLANESAGFAETWSTIASSRIQEEFHVTLSHILDSKVNVEKKKIWKSLQGIFQLDGKLDSIHYFDVYTDLKLKSIVLVKNKLVCVEVEILKSYDSSFEVEIQGIKSSNTYPHITIGTYDPSVKPFQSNGFLEELKKSAEGQLNNATFSTESGDEIRIIDLKDTIILEKQRCYVHQ
ncbi:tRNA ligase [[Candida] railenensis]|uniref:tRNA ligase n=1 Tax=[Candida] railenensis TaxID=45579 RepID=A0A9P0QMY8_9ASCO|nr:tRNA ligase [[Candida] railenensis]